MNARWLTDLDVFNEWMNEEDYELTDADGSVSNEHLVFLSHLTCRFSLTCDQCIKNIFFSVASVPEWFFYNVTSCQLTLSAVGEFYIQQEVSPNYRCPLVDV